MNKNIQRLYSTFGIPLKYDIDLGVLKKNYYRLAKDSQNNDYVNDGYKRLKDDYLRAKAFLPDEIDLDQFNKFKNNFLDTCLDLETKIAENKQNRTKLNKIAEELDRKIDECKEHYNEIEYLNKWSYYRRLRNMIE